MNHRSDSKTKTLLPRTLQQFLAQKKKQQITITNSTGKRTTRKDEFPSFQPPKQQLKQTRKGTLLDQQDNYDSAEPLPPIRQKLIYSEYEEVKEQMLDEHFQKLKNKVKDALNKIPKEDQSPIKVAELMRELEIQLLGSGDLLTLEEEFKKNKTSRNYSAIDPILQRNKLIGIFAKQKREILYRGSELLIFEKGQQVYKEGSRSGSMYIVVKGYVKILETKQTSYGQKIVLEFNTLHEGSHFGSNALGDQQLKHNTNTAITSAKTYLLKMDSELYKELMINSQQNDFEKKIQVINLIPFLRTQTKMSLTPLISCMKQSTFKFGEVIIRKGHTLDKIWIVGEGTLQVILEQRATRRITSTQERRKERSFVFGNCKVKPLNKRRFADTLYIPEKPTNKSLLYGNKVLINEDELEYTDQVVFGQIQRGQCFGGRALYPEFYKTQKQNKFPEFKFDTSSKLDVVCNCIRAVVYQLDQKKFGGLPDSLQKTIIQGLCANKDFDYEDIQKKVKQKHSWKEYSAKIVETIRKDNKGRTKSLYSH